MGKSRGSVGRVMGAVAVAAVVLAAYSPGHQALAAANLLVSVPAMLLARARPEALTIAAVQVILAGLLGPSMRASHCPAAPPSPSARAAP